MTAASQHDFQAQLGWPIDYIYPIRYVSPERWTIYRVPSPSYPGPPHPRCPPLPLLIRYPASSPPSRRRPSLSQLGSGGLARQWRIRARELRLPSNARDLHVLGSATRKQVFYCLVFISSCPSYIHSSKKGGGGVAVPGHELFYTSRQWDGTCMGQTSRSLIR